VAGTEGRLGPLEERDVAGWCASDHFTHALEPRSVVIDQLLRGVEPARDISDRQDVLLDLRQIAGSEREHARRIGQIAQRPHQLVARRRTDLTEVLREHDVGAELFEQDLVDLVKAFAGSQVRRDGGVDFFLRLAFERQRRLAHDRERPDFGWEIAFVGAPHQLLTRTECASDLGRGGKKADDSHPEIYFIRSAAWQRRGRS